MLDHRVSFKQNSGILNLFAIFGLDLAILGSELVQSLIEECRLHLFNGPLFILVFVEIRVHLHVTINQEKRIRWC